MTQTVITSSSSASDSQLFTTRPAWRFFGVCLLLALMIVSIALLRSINLPLFAPQETFVGWWLVSFAPYLVCCLFILRTRPQTGRWRLLEVGVILLGAFVLRTIFLSTAPGLSRDAWRYLWDARVTLHGFSPYAYVPDDPLLVPLHDTLVYGHMDYRTVPTLYPPVAQAIYLLSYLLAPSNIYVLKGIFALFDMVTCVVLALLLHRKGLDPSRCLLYAWCPLPLVEFTIQGHIDVVMLTFTVLMIFTASNNSRRGRILTGFLLGLATLTKLYPLIFLLVVFRRRDYALLVTCIITIIVGYLPYFLLGHGQVFGFFSTYINQHGGNAGPVLLVLQWLGDTLGINSGVTSLLERGFDLLLIGCVALGVLRLRWREQLSMEAALLILIGTFFAISSFVYPWYVAVFLPWVALLIGPQWLSTGKGVRHVNTQNLVLFALWYFVCITPIDYFFLGKSNWSLYYILTYCAVGALLSGAVIMTVGRWHKLQGDREGLPM